MKKEIEDLGILQVQASAVTRMHQRLVDLKREVAEKETDLLAAGSTRTLEEVQLLVDPLKAEKFVFSCFRRYATHSRNTGRQPSAS